MADRPDSNRSGAARRGTATHIAGATAEKKAPWAVIGIAAVAVIAIVAFLFNDPNKAERNFGKAVEGSDARSNASSRGQRGGFKLADSTAVKMGSETTVRIPPNFLKENRGVGVVGTAQFTAGPASGAGGLPFRVRARNVGVMSNGGTFIVTAFAEDKDVYVKAVDNALTVHPKADEKDTVAVPAGPGMAISADGKTRALSQAESDGAFSWVDGSYTANAMPLSQTIPLVLQRWYNTNAQVGDKSLESRPVTAKMTLESSKQALEMINAATNTHIEFRGDTLTLVDGVGKAAGAKPAAKPAAKKSK
ncbi:MAG: FecR domain-containing protein [Gemmatimonas sp.]